MNSATPETLQHLGLSPSLAVISDLASPGSSSVQCRGLHTEGQKILKGRTEHGVCVVGWNLFIYAFICVL